jgi:hypothetical protein
MRTGKKLKPGAPGTKKLLAKYGGSLVCVRYRYDIEQRRRYKTIELIIDEAFWQPRANKIMNIQVKYEEAALRKQVKSAGGKWNGKKQVWELPFREVLRLGLSDRIR